MELHAKIKSTSSLSGEAFKVLKSFQKGDRKLLKTGRDYIDGHIGGLMPSNLILIGGGSGTGKTLEASKIVKNILNDKINSQANDIVTLEFMLEMTFLDLLLRDAHAITKKKKTDILKEEFTEEQREMMNEYAVALRDGRRFVVDESVNSQEFFEIADNFCSLNQDKEGILIAIDHLLLITAYSKMEDPLEQVAIHTNILRKKYPNVYFLYLSQLNRTNYANIKEKSNMMIPTVATIYGSSHFEFLASYVAIITNPFKMGVQEYMKVKKDRYPYLSDFMTSADSKGNTNFKTLGNLFIHVLKTRESDTPFNNLHIERMDLTEEQLVKMKMDVDSEEKISFGDVAVPKFPVVDLTTQNYNTGRDIDVSKLNLKNIFD